MSDESELRLPEGRVLTPADARRASLKRIVERHAKIWQRILHAGPPEQGGTADLDDYLELLAVSAAAARAAISGRGYEIRNALVAGATWHQVTDATGLTADEARAEFEEWANSPEAIRGRERWGETFEDAIEPYLRAGDDEVVTRFERLGRRDGAT
jgi:hypothetical protein